MLPGWCSTAWSDSVFDIFFVLLINPGAFSLSLPAGEEVNGVGVAGLQVYRSYIIFFVYTFLCDTGRL